MKIKVLSLLIMATLGCQHESNLNYTNFKAFAKKIGYPAPFGQKTILVLNVDGCGGCLDLIANNLNSFDHKCDGLDLILVSRSRNKYISYKHKFDDYSPYFDNGGAIYQTLPEIENLHYLLRINADNNIDHQPIKPENIEEINAELTKTLKKCIY